MRRHRMNLVMLEFRIRIVMSYLSTGACVGTRSMPAGTDGTASFAHDCDVGSLAWFRVPQGLLYLFRFLVPQAFNNSFWKSGSSSDRASFPLASMFSWMTCSAAPSVTMSVICIQWFCSPRSSLSGACFQCT